MKTLRFFGMVLLAIALCVNLSSCGGDDEDGFSYEGNNNSVGPSVDLSKYVSASVNYHDYAWYISINNRLKEVFPSDNIRLGVAMGYNGVAIDFYKYFENSDRIESIEPLFIGVDSSPFSAENLYWSSYMALKDKYDLDRDERDLFNEVVSLMNEAEPSAYSKYWGIIFATINGEKQIIRTFGQQRQGSNDDSSNDGSNDNPSYERPDVSFYDYSATERTLSVEYKIYNRDEAKVSSAKIYYGTSRNPSTPVSTSVSGVKISAYIRNLKPGTTYYVKCVAKGRGGETTTEVTKCMTLY